MVAENVRALMVGMTLAVVAWGVLTRWPRDWVRLLIAEAMVGGTVGVLMTLLVRG